MFPTLRVEKIAFFNGVAEQAQDLDVNRAQVEGTAGA
jgi:hypothetical protein